MRRSPSARPSTLKDSVDRPCARLHVCRRRIPRSVLAVARWLTQDNRERDAVTDLLRAQAHGDVAAMLALLDGCAANSACLARVKGNAQRLRRRGDVEIVRYDSSTAHALSTESGPTRVVWTDGTKAPVVVQCV